MPGQSQPGCAVSTADNTQKEAEVYQQQTESASKRQGKASCVVKEFGTDHLMGEVAMWGGRIEMSSLGKSEDLC